MEGRDVDAELWQVQQFAQHRPRLRAVAYRLLGSLGEADDAGIRIQGARGPVAVAVKALDWSAGSH